MNIKYQSIRYKLHFVYIPSEQNASDIFTNHVTGIKVKKNYQYTYENPTQKLN